MPLIIPVLAYSIFLILGVVHWSLQHRIYKRLREHHLETWQTLGSPTLWNGGVFSRFPYYRFVWLGASGAVGDSEIDRSVRWLRFVEVLALTALITGVLTQPASWLDSRS
jgi:hypothetical protein